MSVSRPVEFTIEAQPDSTTCGPTCLHAVYRHFGDTVTHSEVIDQIQRLDHGGTLDVFLANHALARGYRATIYTWNLKVFDPTWFADRSIDIAAKLRAQAEAKHRHKLTIATRGYIEFLESGGRLQFTDLNRRLLYRLLARGHPVLTGLSATYLYGAAREWGPDDEDDDIRGEPVGHFVILSAYDKTRREITIADPMGTNPSGSHFYRVHIDRVIAAILLGAFTYDANLLVIRPCGS